MFEKEAKERARKLEESQTLGVYDNDEDCARDSGWNDGEVAGYEEGFIDGAAFGYNKANEWHDLRKNPNDLPDTDRNVLVKRESEVECQIDNYYNDDNGKGWGIMFKEGYCTDDVILWREIPRFEEERE